ncbi:MAG: hypothetical protein ABIY56_09775, partial [Dokdonella sp.]
MAFLHKDIKQVIVDVGQIEATGRMWILLRRRQYRTRLRQRCPNRPDVLGFDVLGFDVLGFDVLGFDVLGFDAFGLDAFGFDAFGFDALGFDVFA